ncbi:hypothetical protein LOD99_6497 [Oopsacas minuta]|uniref:Uncharacterized protein n=1 Tax=Oopsacas minuta TaxID=111878 RepID=A0AAV7JLN9_9METZ|nr:hypothetical protein LOD99_6497 [Oopsacas minuta]
MSTSIEKSQIFPEQKFNTVVTCSNSVDTSSLLPIVMSQPNAQPEPVCIVITDPNQPKQYSNSILSVPNVISYSNPIIPNLYYLGQDIPNIVPATPPGTESNISVVTPTKTEIPLVNNHGFFPIPLSQPQLAKKPLLSSSNIENHHSSTSSCETISEKTLSGNDQGYKILDKRLRVMEGLMKQSIKLQKRTLRHQERMEKIIQHCMKAKYEEQTVASGTNRMVHFQRYLNDAQPPPLFRYSSHPENIVVPVIESSSPSDSPTLYFEPQKEDSISPNLTIDMSLMEAAEHKSPHKYHSHSCSMYNKSIRDFNDVETIQWLDRILTILGLGVTVEKIQEVLSQTNTITHFTAEFQKVVFSNHERKTLTTSGKFRKRKLERIVLGPLDGSKLQGIIQLSLYLFGVAERDEDRVKYQLKQAIDEKNRREFYREDRGTKRVHLSSIPN